MMPETFDVGLIQPLENRNKSTLYIRINLISYREGSLLPLDKEVFRMLYSEIMDMYFSNYIKTAHVLFGENANILMFNITLNVVATTNQTAN
jgi:hypothetical protein